VRAVAGVAKSFRGALAKLAGIPPIYGRVAVCTGGDEPTAALRERAAQSGVGLVTVADGLSHSWCATIDPVIGVPAIYRWWVAEIVYDSWRQA
jgi:hypothetical protein